MAGGRDAVLAHRHAARREISLLTFGAGSTPPWPGLAPWLSLISTILICSLRRGGRELLGGERAVGIAAAEIARADLPDDVAAAFAVIGAEAAFAGVVREAAHLGAGVERADGVGAERAEAHGRDVEHARPSRAGVHSGPPIEIRNGSLASGRGAIEWFIHS